MVRQEQADRTKAEDVTFYVATDGNDRWSGKLSAPNAEKTDGPFATLEQARVAVLALKAGQAVKRPITVVVRGGKHYFEDTLVFTAEDSGTPEFPIHYQALDGENVILSGGKKLVGWKLYKGEILRAEIADCKGGAWKFRQLFLNGRRQIRSRHPKCDAGNPLFGGWAFIEGSVQKKSTTAFVYKPGTFQHQWAKPANGEVFVFPTGGWTNNIVPIKAVNTDERTITLTRSIQDPDRSPWFFPQPFNPGDRFRVENLLEELTEPGEWCLDSEDGSVYFWPPDGPLRPTDEVVAPALDTLISIRGASWLVISGFTFTETTGGDDLHRDGLDGYGPMYPNQGWKYCGEALHMREAEHCVIAKNRFYAVGGNAIFLERYNARNVIRQNEISHAGANGVCFLGNHIRHPAPTYVAGELLPVLPWIMKKQPLPMFNEVTDNHIHHCGVYNKYVAGVFLGISDGNFIAHNRIEQMPASAVNLGQNSFGRNIVEYNEIRHVCLETAPSGAIQLWMDNEANEERTGHMIRFNLIADTQGCATDGEGRLVIPHPRTHAIYLDNYSSNCLVVGNVIVRVSGNGIFVHAGKNHLVENNVFVDTRGGAIGCGYGFNPVPGFLTGHRFCRNITYYTKAKAPLYHFLLYEWSDEVVSRAEKNTFFCPEDEKLTVRETKLGETLGVREFSFDEWRAMGYDTDSIVKDPAFVDPAHDDYRLGADSPAIQLGFVPIKLFEVGIRQVSSATRDSKRGNRELNRTRKERRIPA